MPTVGERLATLEQIARENRERIDRLLDAVEGGGDVTYERSVRGRLHAIEGTIGGMVLRRTLGMGQLKGWQAVLLVACAVGTVVAAWYGVLRG